MGQHLPFSLLMQVYMMFRLIRLQPNDSSIQVLIKKSKAEIEKGDLEEASRYSNLALKLDITNPDLQFFNGFVYHLMGVQGDSSKFDLAEQGFKQALKFDPGNLAARYQLGLLYADQRRFGLAQGHFAAVALHKGDDPAVLYNLATASYYARDPKTAEAALKRFDGNCAGYCQWCRYTSGTRHVSCCHE